LFYICEKAEIKDIKLQKNRKILMTVLPGGLSEYTWRQILVSASVHPPIFSLKEKKSDLYVIEKKQMKVRKKVAKVLIVLASERLGRSYIVQEFEKAGLLDHHLIRILNSPLHSTGLYTDVEMSEPSCYSDMSRSGGTMKKKKLHCFALDLSYILMGSMESNDISVKHKMMTHFNLRFTQFALGRKKNLARHR
jgi:hypothetical protein